MFRFLGENRPFGKLNLSPLTPLWKGGTELIALAIGLSPLAPLWKGGTELIALAIGLSPPSPPLKGGTGLARR
jgi:hypothetical protein